MSTANVLLKHIIVQNVYTSDHIWWHLLYFIRIKRSVKLFLSANDFSRSFLPLALSVNSSLINLSILTLHLVSECFNLTTQVLRGGSVRTCSMAHWKTLFRKNTLLLLVACSLGHFSRLEHSVNSRFGQQLTVSIILGVVVAEIIDLQIERASSWHKIGRLLATLVISQGGFSCGRLWNSVWSHWRLLVANWGPLVATTLPLGVYPGRSGASSQSHHFLARARQGGIGSRCGRLGLPLFLVAQEIATLEQIWRGSDQLFLLGFVEVHVEETLLQGVLKVKIIGLIFLFEVLEVGS